MYYKIKNFCDSKGITIHQMCVELGINDSVISNLKNREKQKSVNAKHAGLIADYMGVSVSELVGDD